ncbi:MAG: cobalamin B12-binding domain-containing protein, partial [bacterium]|nr:cobalamin B12-binding domain-containing protein [bacterium]
MRILLTTGPASKHTPMPVPSIVFDKGNSLPLALLYVGASLRDAGYSDVQAMDAYSRNLDPPQMAERIREYEPDVLGVSVYTADWREVCETMLRVRQSNPDCHIVMGGPHVFLYPEETWAHPS